MLGAVLGPAANVRLDDVGPVQERLRAVVLDPDLVARALGDDGQRRDVQAELARLGHLAEAGAQAEERVAADAGGEVGEGELDVVDLFSGGGV